MYHYTINIQGTFISIPLNDKSTQRIALLNIPIHIKKCILAIFPDF